MFAWAPEAGGVRLAVRVTPRGGRDAVEGLGDDGDGVAHVKVRVATAPVEGAANDAVEKAVAKWLGVKPRDVEVIAGEAARIKQLRIDGDPVAIVRKLQALTGARLTTP